MQKYLALLYLHAFEQQVLSHPGDHDLPVRRSQRPVDDDDVVRADTGPPHRVATDANKVAGKRMGDDQIMKVQGWFLPIVPRAGKPCVDRLRPPAHRRKYLPIFRHQHSPRTTWAEAAKQ